MRGWNRTSLKSAVKTKTFWLRYCLVLAQILVTVAYLLPWRRFYSGLPYPDRELLEWMYSELTHDPSTSQAFFIASLITCFMAAIISLILTLLALIRREELAPVLRVSSMFSSLAIVGPLLYLHWCMPWPFGSADLSHLWPAITEMLIGWYIALLSGSVACALSLMLYRDARKASRESTLARIHGTIFSCVHLLIIVICCAVIVAGFFLTWNAGFSTGPGLSEWRDDIFPYSNSGFEISLLMYLVPFASALYTGLLIFDMFVRKATNLKSRQLSQNLLIVAFGLTLFWGLAFGEYRFFGVDTPLFVAKLQLGWYLCVISQLIMLVSAVSFHNLHFTTMAHRKPLHFKGAWE